MVTCTVVGRGSRARCMLTDHREISASAFAVMLLRLLFPAGAKLRLRVVRGGSARATALPPECGRWRGGFKRENAGRFAVRSRGRTRLFFYTLRD